MGFLRISWLLGKGRREWRLRFRWLRPSLLRGRGDGKREREEGLAVLKQGIGWGRSGGGGGKGFGIGGWEGRRGLVRG